MPGHFATAVAGFVLGILAVAGVAVIRQALLYRGRKTVQKLLERHFGKDAGARIDIHSRDFPYRVAVDAYQAVSDWIAKHAPNGVALGVPVTDTMFSHCGIATLLAPAHEQVMPTAIEYESFNVGAEQPAACPKHALWLIPLATGPAAILWTSFTAHSGCGFTTKLHLEFAALREAHDGQSATDFFTLIEQAIQSASSYRGKVLSLEDSGGYSGESIGLKVHTLREVSREEVILPESTLRLLERNILRFTEQRSQLARLGMSTKKGLLFYGPPGTGKSHTIQYLIKSLAGHTTLIMTAEQVGLLDEYMALARLLQPSVVVLEDVDLIGRDREHQTTSGESLLNRLLNEMDGLQRDTQILFLMTTNRPETLETALAARPGRIDQAIEFPLPDEHGRRKLIQLYSAGAKIAGEVVAHTARVTAGVSAAFIKELMRRAIQFHLECNPNGESLELLQNDIDQAIEELLFVGGTLNRKLLGAGDADGSDG